MQDAQKLFFGIDTVTATNAILRQGSLFKENTLILRSPTPEGKLANWFSLDLFPQLRQYIFGLMGRIDGEILGKVWLSIIPSGEEITVEADISDDLFFMALAASPGVQGKVGETNFPLAAGEAFWSNSAKNLHVANASPSAAILLFARATPNAPATYAPEE